MVTIVDYGMGNLGSVLNMFKKVGVQAKIVADLDEIGQAKKLLLPGVGAFDTAMNKINESGLRRVLDHKALVEKIPILGICLGMQLLTNRSEEGKLRGLGWINGETLKFDFPQPTNLKVPHMGWNGIKVKTMGQLVANLGENPRFYFVHSFFVKVANEDESVAETFHGIWFDSVIRNGNIWGAQFHPEKSHTFGMKIMENFASI